MLAVIHLLPAAYYAGAVVVTGVGGWLAGRKLKKIAADKKLREELEKTQRENDRIKASMNAFRKEREEEQRRRDQAHEDDLLGIEVTEDGRTQEEVDMGITPAQTTEGPAPEVSKEKTQTEVKEETPEEPISEEEQYLGSINNTHDERFKLMDIPPEQEKEDDR